jgi:fibronectin type 3 domain-containing protein
MPKRILSVIIAAVLMVGMSTTLPISAAALEAASEPSTVADVIETAASVVEETIEAENTEKEEIAETGAVAKIAKTGVKLLSENEFAQKLAELRKKYPDGGTFSGVYYEDGVAKAYTCFAYSVQMLYEVFGIQFYNDGYLDKLNYTMGTIYAGDIVRINDRHSIFIIKVEGDKYYYTDGNGDGANGIRWDGVYTKAELTDMFTWKVHVDGNTLTGGGSTYELDTPELSEAVSVADGLIITWNEVPDAVGYRVYYKPEGQTSWKTLVANTEDTAYLFTEAEYASTYTFTVRAINSKGEVASDFIRDGITAKYGYQPTLTSASEFGKITLVWDPFPKANAYRLFVKSTKNTKWQKVIDTDELSYEFTSGVVGETYTFTLRYLDENGRYMSDYDPVGVSERFYTYETQLVTPSNIKAAPTNVPGTVKVTWDAVPGVIHYLVFYREGTGGGWTRLATTEDNAYLHADCVNNTTYSYTIRCIDDDGRYMSAYNKTGAALHYYDYPETVKAVATTTQGAVKITWNAIEGAEKYQLFVKRTDQNSGWKKLAQPTTNSYTQTKCANDAVYTYTVRCIDSTGAYLSGYLAKGASIHYYRYPENLKAVKWGNQILFSYSEVEGAASYAVFWQSSASKGWKRLSAETTRYPYQAYTGCKNGVKYYFTVRACDENGNLISSYNPSGVSLTYSTKSVGSWSALYKSFVINKQYLKAKTPSGFTAAGAPSMSLYDMNQDGVPELILDSGLAPISASPQYVFTVKDGKVVYIGSFNSNYMNAYVNPSCDYKSLFVETGSAGSGYDVCYVYINKAGKVNSIPVVSYVPNGSGFSTSVKHTGYYKLYTACTCSVDGRVPTGIYGVSKKYSYLTIKSADWNNFVAASVY